MTLSFTPSEIETWPLARLKPYAKNAKTHGAEQVTKIAASMADLKPAGGGVRKAVISAPATTSRGLWP